MKKLFTILAFVFATTVMAQTPDIRTEAKTYVSTMNDALQLTGEQQTLLYDKAMLKIRLQYAANNNFTNESERIAEIDQIETNWNTAVQEILTPQQFTIFEEKFKVKPKN